MIDRQELALQLPDWRHAADALIAAVAAQRDELRAVLRLEKWRAVNGMIPPNEIAIAADGWEEAVVPYSWSPRDYSKTLHYALKLEPHKLGIDLRGSRATIEMWAPTGAQVYVNGEHAYGGDYWADTQVVPIVLSESLDGAADFDIVVHFRQGDGFGFFFIADLTISALDERLFELDLFAEELAFAVFLADRPAAEKSYGPVLAEAVEAFDSGALARRDWPAVDAAIAKLRGSLAGFEPLAKSYKVFMAGHAHIDMNWLWPQSETEELIRRDFESMDGIMADYPEVVFSHSQAYTYQLMEQRQPELFARIKKRIDSGQWEVTSSTWVEGDLNMAGYETLARQFLEGMTYSRERLGVAPEIGWEPDTFGHPATMPDVLSQAGIRYYYHMRPARDVPVYWWEGPGGARVLAFNDPQGYFGRVYPSLIIPGSIRMAEQFGLACNLYVYGIGDHGGGVTRDDVRRARRMQTSGLLPQIIFAKAVDYYREVEQSGAELPVIRGELNGVFEGCYTSHGDIKKANRETEHKLVRAEAVAAIAASHARSTGNGREAVETSIRLRAAWRTQLFNQFHDIVCGCSIRQTYDAVIPAAAEAAAEADRTAMEAAGTLVEAEGMQTDVAPDTITLWNTLSWTRTDTVELPAVSFPQLAEWRTGDRLVDGNGGEAIIQRTSDAVLFVARDVPPLGFKRYTYAGGPNSEANAATAREAAGQVGQAEEAGQVEQAGQAGQGEQAGQAAQAGQSGGEAGIVGLSKSGNPVLTNSRLAVEIDRESGTIVSLLDLAAGRELSYTPPDAGVEANQTKGLLNLFEVQYEAPHWMSAWKLGTITGSRKLVSGAEVSIGEQGPVMQSVRVVHRFDGSVIEQEIRLYRDIDRIDFRNRVDWAGLGSDAADAPALRVLFTPKLNGTSHTFDVPFGAVERYPDGREAPANHWADLSETNYGMSLLNDGKYGHSMQGNTLGLSLIRSSYEPDNLGDRGDHHRFAYALYLHAGAWREAGTVRRAWEFNQPMLAVAGKSSALPEGGGCWSALRLTGTDESQADGISAIVTSFKQARSGRDEWIVRIAETAGRRLSLKLEAAFLLTSACCSNLMEDGLNPLPLSVSGGQSVVQLGELSPWEVRTVRLRT